MLATVLEGLAITSVSNQVGAPASGAVDFANKKFLVLFPIKWGPQRVGPWEAVGDIFQVIS